MRERDIHNLIEQQNPEVKQEIWERICSQIDMTELQPKKAAAVKPKRWKWAVVALAIVCVVTLSIVLPLTLKSGDGVRYCDATQYELESLGQTLKEYAVSHDYVLLYVDWYDVADALTTDYGHIIDDKNDILFFKESMINMETGEAVVISITDNKTRVDIFEEYYEKCEEFTINNIGVNWRDYNLTHSLATFEYKGYIYYLKIDEGNAKDRLTEIITDMIK